MKMKKYKRKLMKIIKKLKNNKKKMMLGKKKYKNYKMKKNIIKTCLMLALI